MGVVGWVMAALLKGQANREGGKPAAGLKPLVEPKPEPAPRPAVSRLPRWLLAEAPGVFGAGVETATARTKSEARAELKRRLGLKRLPAGAVVQRLAALLLMLLASQASADPQDAAVRIPSHGCSGTVIHTEQGRSLVLTCAHAWESEKDRRQPIVIDAPAPLPGAQRTGGIRVLKTSHADDLVLIEMRTGPLPYVCPVAPLGWRPGRCISVGYDRMQPAAPGRPLVRAAHITGYDARRFASPVSATYTYEQPWHGRSGGALIDADAGRLIGVVSGYETEPGGRFIPGRSRGIYVSHAAVYAFLWGKGPPPRTSEVREPWLAPNCRPGR